MPVTTRCNYKTGLLLVVLFSLLCSLGARLERSIWLEWNPSPDPDIASYNVYYGDLEANDLTVARLGNVNAIELIGLDPARTYFIYVTAVNLAGLESEPSNILIWRHDDPDLLEVEEPRNDRVSVIGSFLWQSSNVAMSHLVRNGEGAVFLERGPALPAWTSAHNLYYGSFEDNAIHVATLAMAGPPAFIGFEEGKTYFFFVTLLNESGRESEPSNVIIYQASWAALAPEPAFLDDYCSGDFRSTSTREKAAGSNASWPRLGLIPRTLSFSQRSS
jgi:hypothetical protein